MPNDFHHNAASFYKNSIVCIIPEHSNAWNEVIYLSNYAGKKV